MYVSSHRLLKFVAASVYSAIAVVSTAKQSCRSLNSRINGRGSGIDGDAKNPAPTPKPVVRFEVKVWLGPAAATDH